MAPSDTAMEGSLLDCLVLGGGPAALCMAAALAEQELRVALLAPHNPRAPWPNTYGIWGEEVDALGLTHLMEHRWSNTISYFGEGAGDPASAANAATPHGRDYGLFNRQALQHHWLSTCERGGVVLLQGMATQCTVSEGGGFSAITTAEGIEYRARLVIDASGHQPVLIQRPDEGPVAGQAAYGIVGRFSTPPVEPGQFVLMDYRSDHLNPREREQPPTFLYAMDMGDGVFFVEETSLALAPPVAYDILQQRLKKRLAHRGMDVLEVLHEEFCLFPMNLPLPELHQPVLGFGGAASMVHPASGYMVGTLLRRAPSVARAVADAMNDEAMGSAPLARIGWEALWPLALRRKHALYQFGLEKLMRFPEWQLRAFFSTFFSLPNSVWYGFLTNTLSFPQLLRAMVQLFFKAPWCVRWGLIQMKGRELRLGLRLLWPAG